MNRVRAVALRELRAYFHSPIAYVFLLVFALAALFTFFNQQAFFARGQADLRGLFDAIPLLTVLLVPALTMRLWAEEAKQGTLEILVFAERVDGTDPGIPDRVEHDCAVGPCAWVEVRGELS